MKPTSGERLPPARADAGGGGLPELPELGERYRIESELGHGGMGRVFAAHDLKLDRRVAIKLLPARAHTADELRRFSQEARAAGSLAHPNILAVHDVGTCAAGPYIVAELLSGSTLRERFGAAPLPLKTAVRYTIQLALGLAAAHERGVVHRDIKPENLFVTNDGGLKILDFGLAKLTGAAAPEAQLQAVAVGTRISAVLGTVEYMSPEQVRGRAVDHRSDIFSAGIILYEMLAGKWPFQRATPIETGTAILNDDPPDLPAQVSLEVDRIVRRCLEKSPERRYQSAKDLALDLEHAAVHPLRSARAYSIRKWRKALVVLALAMAAAIAGVIVGARAWHAQRPEFRQLTFRRGTMYSARFASDGQTVVYSAAWEGAPRPEIFSSRVQGPESSALGLQNANVLSLSRAGEILVQLGIRRETWRATGTLARVQLAGGAPREVLENVSDADWAPDGASFAIVRDVAGRSRIEYPPGKVLFETTGWVSHLRFSPKGDRLAFLDHPARFTKVAAVSVIDLPADVRTLVPASNIAQGLAWAPKGDEIWFTMAEPGKREGLRAVTLSGRQRTLLSVPGSLRLLDADREGRILLAHESVRLVLTALPPGEATERELSWFDWPLLGDLSRDGKTILFTERTSPPDRVYLRQTDGSPAIFLGQGVAWALSPDANWVLASASEQPPRLVLLPTGSGQPKPVPSGEIDALAGRWSGDGKQIVIAGRERGHPTRLYVLGEEAPKAITPGGMSLFYAVSHDGAFVAATDGQGHSALYPVKGGEPQPLPELNQGDYPFAWSDDGRLLYAFRHGEVPCTVYRLDLATRRKEIWKMLRPSDLTGVPHIGRVQITPDAKSYAYGQIRQLSELYLVEGVK
jgi:Tol biopolymer transport system component/tRNA A-37 threonylcarbamoyl transferase component Bud32